jgi:polysaccharide biosynthesis/export protein
MSTLNCPKFLPLPLSTVDFAMVPGKAHVVLLSALRAWLAALLVVFCGFVQAQGAAVSGNSAPAALAINEVGAGYRLGAGDIVRITVYNQPELSTEAQIKEAGQITFALIGEVRLAGLDKAAAETLIAQRLREGGFVRQPQVNLLVTAYRSQVVAVLGEVNRPGRYPIENATTLTDLLAQAGGINPTTGGDLVTLVRQDASGKPTRIEIDLKDVFGAQGQGGAQLLAAGDVIFVPRAPVFYVYGEVQRPGAYRLERQMTVMQALSVSGGLTPRGTERGMKLTRRAPDGQLQTYDVVPSNTLREGDVLVIRQSIF